MYNYVIDKHEKEWKSNKRSGADVTTLLQFRTILTSFMNSLLDKAVKEASDPPETRTPHILLPLELQESGTYTDS